jgi:hypothetical protein
MQWFSFHAVVGSKIVEKNRPTRIVLYFCFVFLRLVHTMLPVSLDYPILILPSVFSNVYLYSLHNCVDRLGNTKNIEKIRVRSIWLALRNDT